MVIPPCRDCPNRAIPKTCEKTCEKWLEYEKSKNEEKEKVKSAKRLSQLIGNQIWKNRKKGINKWN